MLKRNVIFLTCNNMFWKRKSRDFQERLERNNFVLKVTNGSPKLKDVLRKRLKEHVKLRRDSYVSNLRRLGEDAGSDGERMTCGAVSACPNQGVLGEIDQLAEEDQELRTLEEIEREELTREEAWFLEQCEQFLREDNAVLDSLLAAISSEGVLCPLCSRSTLVACEGQGLLYCSACRVSVHWPHTLDDLGRALCQCINTHHRTCSQPAGFAVVPEGDRHSLVIACTACGLFNLV